MSVDIDADRHYGMGMNTTRTCLGCDGGGYVQGTYGFSPCDVCDGLGNLDVQLCDVCAKYAATSEVDGTVLCDRCASEFPTVVPPAPDTIPCPPPCGDPANENGEQMLCDLASSLELIEDAKAAGVPPFEALHLVRRGIALRAGSNT